jgi:hypothetical protein
VEASNVRKTRQGVRDLNGPRLDGRHNGKGGCTHWRTELVTEIGEVDAKNVKGETYKRVTTVKIERCLDCYIDVEYQRKETPVSVQEAYRS